ncbi:hypothetical protein D1953_00185 [Peribacillus asahii]|uniref:Uncharacterized protein n=1 Tax=Peribacillus asahii TaxID=228899 RepID=A0A398BG31_9BACI|nr:hypothetical protein [Peribacillus asahii]RID89032.1 hypothetical protein D1953_00185 [Peribacillus asahii]
MNILKKKIFIILAVLLFSIVISNPNVLANSKKQLAQLVMEHEDKINNLIKDVDILKKETQTTNEVLTEETKQALLKEYRGSMQYLITPEDEDKIKIVETKIVEKDGEYVFQVYTEGTAGYTHSPENVWSFEPGKVIAFNTAQNFNTINTMYNVDLSLEFYHNGEQVKMFARP